MTYRGTFIICLCSIMGIHFDAMKAHFTHSSWK